MTEESHKCALVYCRWLHYCFTLVRFPIISTNALSRFLSLSLLLDQVFMFLHSFLSLPSLLSVSLWGFFPQSCELKFSSPISKTSHTQDTEQTA